RPRQPRGRAAPDECQARRRPCRRQIRAAPWRRSGSGSPGPVGSPRPYLCLAGFLVPATVFVERIADDRSSLQALLVGCRTVSDAIEDGLDAGGDGRDRFLVG